MIDRWGRNIRSFWKRRKQDDRVKLLCMFVLAGIGFFISVIYHTREIYCYVNTPAEYMLKGNGIVSEGHVDVLLQNGAVTGVSRQMDVPMTVMYHGAGTSVNCTILSREYIEDRFGVRTGTGTKRIYMNETAFSQWQQELSDNSGNIGDLEGQKQTEDDMAYDIRYFIEEDTSDQDGGDAVPMQTGKTAKLVVVKTGEQEEGLVFTADSDGRLLKKADSLRVQFGQHDLDGLHVDSLNKMGYTIENEAEVMTEKYEVERRLLHIRYGILSGGLCFLAVFALRELVRHQTDC